MDTDKTNNIWEYDEYEEMFIVILMTERNEKKWVIVILWTCMIIEYGDWLKLFENKERKVKWFHDNCE